MNFKVTAFILTLLETSNRKIPRSMALVLVVEFRVVPSWSRPVKKTVGSAKTMKQAIPFPEQTGFSPLQAASDDVIEAAPTAYRWADSWSFTDELGCPLAPVAAISESSNPAIPNPDLLEYSVAESAAADVKDGARVEAGLDERVEPAAEDEAVEEVEESEEKTDPSTRFAFSREASFLSSTIIREDFLGSGGGCGIPSSKAAKPAGIRVMCIE